MIHERHVKWLEALGIPEALATQYGISTQQDASGYWLVSQYVENGALVNSKRRRISEQGWAWDTGAPLTLWNHQALAEAAATGGTLIIAEEEWDALAMIACGHRLCCSVPNGAPSAADQNPWDAKRYEWVHRHLPDLDRVGKFVLATRGAPSGLALASDLARLLGPERCHFLTYPEGMCDPNGVLVSKGAEALNEMLATAKPYPVKGLYRMSDFPEHGEFRIVKNGIPVLEDMWPLLPGSFSVVTGWPSAGKTSLLMSILGHLIMSGMPIILGSFETMAKPILQRRLRAVIYGCEETHPKANMPGPADDLIEKNLNILSNLGVDDDTELGIEEIIERAIVAVLRDGARLLVLDPWNEIEHKRRPEENETDYIGRAIRLLKRFARDYQCAVWVVGHPRKPSTDGTPKPPSLYDLAGSANWANKADYGVIIHRPDLMFALVDAMVVKVRMGLPGMVGMAKLAYNQLTCRYQSEAIEAPPEPRTEARPRRWFGDTD